MKKLETPFGKLYVEFDNKQIDYEYKEVPMDKSCKDLAGRYAIILNIPTDSKSHKLSCRIENFVSKSTDGAETTENFEGFSCYNNNSKLTIGMIAETGYLEGERLSPFDYDSEILKDGVKYCILPSTKTTKFSFGVAWINNYNKDNEIQTHFGANIFDIV